MNYVSLLFSAANNPLSVMIRTLTWSTYSHVALVDGDTVIEATTAHGVRRAALSDALRSAATRALVQIPCADPQAVLAAATSQLGKPYDYSAILGIGLHRDWQEDDKWFCSELVAWSFQHAGHPLFRAESLRRVTPQHLWMLPAEDAALSTIAQDFKRHFGK
jgi:uncharacterized protein YycO